jgi:hypothetical protein
MENGSISESGVELIHLAESPEEVLRYIEESQRDKNVRSVCECASMNAVGNALSPKF